MLKSMTSFSAAPRSVRVALSAAVLVASGLLAGCPPTQGPTTQSGFAQNIGTAPIVGNEPVAGGIYVSLGSYTPLSGDALKRARSDRNTIRQLVSASVPTTAPASQPAGEKEPPPLAVKYYLQGREKFLDGANTEAMDFL